MSLDAIRKRAEAAEPGPWFLDSDGVSIYYVFHNGDTLDRDRLAESSGSDAEFIAHARTDIPRLLNALDAVLEWCDTNQHPFHPSEGVEGFSSQDWALDDAARRIRTALTDALEVKP
ncbi:hypothetical protein [Arthrobacter sp. NA-172]|uniref:hypothetical protein n=1 Tax=Arthrobacter sp. NA-172 TaxID=3367524 RepID=UPI00375476C5